MIKLLKPINNKYILYLVYFPEKNIYKTKIYVKSKCKKCGKIFYTPTSKNINICLKCNKNIRPITKKYDYINRHYYKPFPTFIINSTKSLTIGLELEVYNPNRNEALNGYIINRILTENNLNTYYYLKHDGSLKNLEIQNYLKEYLHKDLEKINCHYLYEDLYNIITFKDVPCGIEIVSEPFDLKNINRLKINILCDELKKQGFIDNKENTGLHIHLGSTVKNPKQILNMNKLLSYYHHRPFIKSLMRRKFNEYCWPLPIRDIENLRFFKNYLDNKMKYRAINIKPTKTIELRFFRSSINPLIIKSIIEFSHAFYYFTLKYSFENVNEENFIKYILKRIKKYPNLIKYYKLVVFK